MGAEITTLSGVCYRCLTGTGVTGVSRFSTIHPTPNLPQERGKPYVIVFCGVNGVGKSTNLAKIAYWLGQHDIKVTIAACDTFRAGG